MPQLLLYILDSKLLKGHFNPNCLSRLQLYSYTNLVVSLRRVARWCNLMLTYSVIVSKASFFLSLAVAVELVLRGISHNECDFALRKYLFDTTTVQMWSCIVYGGFCTSKWF